MWTVASNNNGGTSTARIRSELTSIWMKSAGRNARPSPTTTNATV
jgi:hypothetical protein